MREAGPSNTEFTSAIALDVEEWEGIRRGSALESILESMFASDDPEAELKKFLEQKASRGAGSFNAWRKLHREDVDTCGRRYNLTNPDGLYGYRLAFQLWRHVRTGIMADVNLGSQAEREELASWIEGATKGTEYASRAAVATAWIRQRKACEYNAKGIGPFFRGEESTEVVRCADAAGFRPDGNYGWCTDFLLEHLLKGIEMKWQLTEHKDEEMFCHFTRSSSGKGTWNVTVAEMRGMAEGWRFLHYNGSHFWAARPEGSGMEDDTVDDRQRVEEALENLTKTATIALRRWREEAVVARDPSPISPPPKANTPEAWLQNRTNSKAGVDPRACLGLFAAASEAQRKVGLALFEKGMVSCVLCAVDPMQLKSFAGHTETRSHKQAKPKMENNAQLGEATASALAKAEEALESFVELKEGEKGGGRGKPHSARPRKLVGAQSGAAAMSAVESGGGRATGAGGAASAGEGRDEGGEERVEGGVQSGQGGGVGSLLSESVSGGSGV